MRYAFAGDRKISESILGFLIEQGFPPLALLVPEGKNVSHSNELINLSGLTQDFVFKGLSFKSSECITILKELDLDYIFGIHFPYIIPENILNIPEIGFLNLHPSFLPFNKGWHTPSWAILEKKPFGATLHFMSKTLDDGDIIRQKQIQILPSDTANILYMRVLDLELDVFKEAFLDLVALRPFRQKQTSKGTSHNRKDLLNIQEINIDEKVKCGVLIDKLRALSTSNINEAAFFEENGIKYAIQIQIQELE